MLVISSDSEKSFSTTVRWVQTAHYLSTLQLFDRDVCAVKRCFAVPNRGESMLESKKDEFVEIKVGFNQQQRQLIEKIKKETDMGKTDTEVIRAVFVQW